MASEESARGAALADAQAMLKAARHVASQLEQTRESAALLTLITQLEPQLALLARGPRASLQDFKAALKTATKTSSLVQQAQLWEQLTLVLLYHLYDKVRARPRINIYRKTVYVYV